MEDKQGKCPTCGVPWADHLGVAGTCAQLAAAIRERDDYKLRAEQAEWIAVVQMTDEYSRDRFSEIYEPLARAIARDNTPPCFDAARLAVLDYLAEYAINHLADAQAEEQTNKGG